MTRAALGFSVHTGWAAMVAVGGARTPQVLMRKRLALVVTCERFVYHASVDTELRTAARLVAAAAKEAEACAAEAIARLASELSLAGCAVVAGPLSPPEDLEAILRSHPMIHTAEGALYRDAIVSAAAQHKLTAEIFPPKTLSVDAPEVAEAGEGLGPPWGKDQKLAVLAAWRMLRRK